MTEPIYVGGLRKETTPQKKKRSWTQAVGEMFSGGLRETRWPWKGLHGRIDTYKLNVSKTNYQLTKELYYNTNEDYYLGAGLLKPIIDTTVGFIGIPSWKSNDESAQSLLDDFRRRNKDEIQKIISHCLRDADCYVRLSRKEHPYAQLYTNGGKDIIIEVLTPESVTRVLDTDTGNPIGFRVTTSVEYTDKNGDDREYIIVETILPDKIETYFDGNDVPLQYKEFDEQHPRQERNKWGFVNIIHFRNDAEPAELYGHSEIEAALPYIKAYHDVMSNSMINNKLHSAPKMIMNVADVTEFLNINFGIDVESLAEGESANINLQGTEILITGNADDTIELSQATSTMTDSSKLLDYLFMSLVDVTQTPEFVFGNAVNSAKASVKEQMTPMIKKVAKKRDMFEPDFILLARMYLYMYNASSFIEGTVIEDYDTDVTWPAVVERDVMTESTAVTQLVNAFAMGIEKKFISVETAINYLYSVMPTYMGKYTGEDGQSELSRIKKGIEFLNSVANPYAEEENTDANSADNTDPADEDTAGLTVSQARQQRRDAKRNAKD